MAAKDLSIANAVKLYNDGEGYSLRQIGKMYGMGPRAVRNRLVLGGARIKEKGGISGPLVKTSHHELRQIAFMYQEVGMTDREIAEVLGYKSCSSVTRKRHLAGIRGRHPNGNTLKSSPGLRSHRKAA